MGKGWGYGNNYDLLNYSKFNKVYENEKLKVYQANIIYMGDLNIKIIHNKDTKGKRVILKYKNRPGKYYDYNNITLNDLISKIESKLLDDYWEEVI